MALRPGWGIPGGLSVADLLPDRQERIEEATAKLEGEDTGAAPDVHLRVRARAYLETDRFTEALADIERILETRPEQEPVLRPMLLRALVEAAPTRAGPEIAKVEKSALPSERVELARLRVRAALRGGDWTTVATAARELEERLASLERDLVRAEREPGSSPRRECRRSRTLARLLASRGRLAAGDVVGAAGLADAALESAPPEMRAEALAWRAVLTVRGEEPEAARPLVEEACRLHEPSRVRLRGRGHALNGWTPRLVSDVLLRLGDEEASRRAFTSAVREGLPRFAEEIVEGGDGD
jgi:hypothetical protein